MVSTDELQFYATQSPFTDPGRFGFLFDHAPEDERDLARWVRNVQFHEVYAAQAGLDLPDEVAGDPATCDGVVRYLEPTLERIVARDNRPLDCERPKNKCFIGLCRDYAALLCALLRHQGRPARVRCGFAFYFEPDATFGADHWVTEVWDAAQDRWRLVDSELDPDLPQHRNITVDPFDLPRDRFQVAATAWRFYRDGKVDPGIYGVLGTDIAGAWFMAGNVLRDVAALNKLELTVFDWWGLGTALSLAGQVEDRQCAVIDTLAAASADEAFDFASVRRLYDSYPEARPSNPIKGWPKGMEVDFALPLD
jgi:hypothetical protein